MKTKSIGIRLSSIKIVLLSFMAIMLMSVSALAQDTKNPTHHQSSENYGNTLNLGLGIGYYGYLGQSVPFIFANYEFKVAKNFTVAPFIGFGSYRSANDYAFGSSAYYYHETVIPIGAKGSYYFDELLGLDPNWDIYAAGSLGFTYSHVTWDNGYTGNTSDAHTASPLYIDLHVGAEYHFNNRLGIYLDLSTGVSTIGLAIHHK